MSARCRLAAFPLLLLLVSAAPGSAQTASSCSISATSVNFGTYNVFAGSPTQSTGTIVVDCGRSVRTVSVKLSRGQSGTYFPRTLLYNGEALSYNLCRDASCTAIWGDGASGTQFFTDTNARNGVPALTIYGAIPAGQDVRAGNYTDTVTVTVEF